MEDTFRYFDTSNGEIDICMVTGFGNIHEISDEYYGYYDMYACEYLKINEKLSREEIIAYGLKLDPYRAQRFIQTLKLTKEEIIMFKKVFQKDSDTLAYIAYYQENEANAFDKKKTR